jgi:hypothetical protein
MSGDNAWQVQLGFESVSEIGAVVLNFVILTAVRRARELGSPFTPVFGVNGQSARVGRKDLVFLSLV